MSTAKKQPTLELLSKSLNVDERLSDSEIEELQNKLIEVTEELEEVKGTLDDYKAAIEAQNDAIDAFKEWLSEQFDSNDYSSIEIAIDDIQHEFKKTIKTITVF